MSSMYPFFVGILLVPSLHNFDANAYATEKEMGNVTANDDDAPEPCAVSNPGHCNPRRTLDEASSRGDIVRGHTP